MRKDKTFSLYLISLHTLPSKANVSTFCPSGLHDDTPDVMFFPEKKYSGTQDTSYVSWAARPKPVSFPMSKHLGNKLGTENVDRETTGKSGSMKTSDIALGELGGSPYSLKKKKKSFCWVFCDLMASYINSLT